MRLISETHALEKLGRIRTEFAARIAADFELRAKSCAACETPGACCLDEHFVNVRISHLEAAAIRNAICELPPEHAAKVRKRISHAAAKYSLDLYPENTYACPLFEKGLGCLVHTSGKPLPCIHHACYENKNDLPPDNLLAEYESRVAELDRRAYGRATGIRAVPIALAEPD